MPYKNTEIKQAYIPQNVSKTSQFYRGFSTLNPSNRGFKLYDYDLVKQDLINHFHTRKGSRLMNPTFGSIIWDLLMEPLTEQVRELLAEDVKTICTSDPRTYPESIKINEYEQGYLIEITMILKNTDQSTVLKLKFDQKLGLQVQ